MSRWVTPEPAKTPAENQTTVGASKPVVDVGREQRAVAVSATEEFCAIFSIRFSKRDEFLAVPGPRRPAALLGRVLGKADMASHSCPTCPLVNLDLDMRVSHMGMNLACVGHCDSAKCSVFARKVQWSFGQ